MSRQVDGKVTPEVLQTILLDEISSRLAELSPEGITWTEKFTATTTYHEFVVLFSTTIRNDGPADIYILDRDHTIDTDRDSPLESGEELTIDLKRRGLHKYYVKTLSGTATVRAFGLR